MNWDQLAGKWSQAKGEIRQRWGYLTDDDLEVIAGSKDKFVGKIQERYGLAEEEAERQVNEWLSWLSAVGRRQVARREEVRK
jgi:uncharacterized protein YjbJ (UPF0337 family)